MSLLKNIYTFGTSFSNAGGFEFDTKPYMIEYYKCLDVELTKENFKYSHILSKLVKDKINVTSLAKDGFGNERIYRKIFELTNSFNFNPSENLFIIEFSDLGRKEVYVNKDKKHGIINYLINPHENNDKNINFVGYSYDYTKTNSKLNNLRELENSFIPFFEKSYDFKQEFNKVMMSVFSTISLLEFLKIPYIIIELPFNLSIFDNWFNSFFNDTLSEKTLNIYDIPVSSYLHEKEQTIQLETNNKIKDGHYGYGGNIIIANEVYNKIIDMELVKGTKIPHIDTLNRVGEIKELLDKNNVKTKYL